MATHLGAMFTIMSFIWAVGPRGPQAQQNTNKFYLNSFWILLPWVAIFVLLLLLYLCLVSSRI